ncbi:SDR family oxidoreductase [Mycolicibacterium helvum]|uniref:Oxidoreductase n=1 Tax=Mycolicibacterium helvum TaxID=1534349 RepID=A0A7I7T1L3_9MYCO|nr:SDR family oxidoreductase [Mycolicibacterium helvum]BBY62115.1 oxidoreductase [Mycolicibacterium helvum]
MSTSLDGAVVLVTGANGGLGVEFVRQALDRGASKVYATARRPRDWKDSRIVPLALDVTDSNSINAAAEAASDTTIVVNNAAIAILPDRLLHLPMAEVRRTFDTNFFGALEVARTFAPVVGNNGGGAFLHVHSVLSWFVGDPSEPVSGGHGAYSASKSAFWSATNTLRLELAGQGTHVLGLHLGYTDTPMIATIDEEGKESPADIVRIAYEGLLAGDFEVVADWRSRTVKEALSGPIEGVYPQLVKAASS